MSDESYLRDLEAAAGAVSDTPNDYALLRSLLASLPSGTAPDVRSGRTGVTATAAGIGGLDAQGLTLQSATPIGSMSGADLGIDQAQTIGLRNFFPDSRLISSDSGTDLLDGLSHKFASDWTAIAALGTMAPTSCQAGQGSQSYNTRRNPFGSATMGLRMSNWAAAGSGTIKAKAALLSRQFDPTVMPYVVFSIVVYKNDVNIQLFNNCSVVNVGVKIRNAADTVDLGASTLIDFKSLGLGAYRRLWVAVPSANWDNDIIAQIQVDITTTGAHGGSGNFTIDIGNPQIEISPYQVPTLFLPDPNSIQPIIRVSPFNVSTQPAITIAHRDDTAGTPVWGRLRLGMASSGAGYVGWGSGAADMDVRIFRNAAGYLVVDGAGTNGSVVFHVNASDAADAQFLVARLSDTHYRLIVGTSSGTPSIYFGPGNATQDVAFLRSAAGAIRVDSLVANTNVANPQFEIAIPASAGGDQVVMGFRIGGTQRATSRADEAGNVVLSGSGTGATYLAWDGGSGGVVVGNGAGGVAAAISSTGIISTPDRIVFTERADPGSSVANTAEVYARDNGAGKTQLVVVFNTGAVLVLATQP